VLLDRLPAGGEEATRAVRAAVGPAAGLVEQLRVEVRDALAGQGLLTAERSKVLGLVPRTRWLRTPTGDAWAAVPRGLERDRTAALPAGTLPAVGLLLALDDEVARVLRSGGDAAVVHVEADGELDGRTLDAVLGDVGTGLDSAVDGGASSSGSDGGDGGGGGD
jgi:hypothetical protein